MKSSTVSIITDILQPTQSKTEETKQFKGVPHDNILYAYKYWLEYLRLLIREPFTIEILQGLQDAGVDLIIKFLKSGSKIGIQVKSYQDLNRPNFQQEVMSQISHSKKHGLEKLLLIPCGDLTNRSHNNKIPNLMSNVSQMNDDYVFFIQPQQSLPVYQCYISQKHPLSYLGRSKDVLDLFQGLGQIFSNDDYNARVHIDFKYKHPEKPIKKDDAHTVEIKFKPFRKGKPENPVDKFLQLYQLGEDVTFGSHDVEELIVRYSDGRTTREKPSNFTMFKHKKSFGPVEFYPKNDKKNILKILQFKVEQEDGNFTIWKSTKESFPWKVELIISKNGLKFSNTLNLSMCNFKHIAIIQRFYMSLAKNKILIIKNSPTNDEIEIILPPDQIIPFSEESLKNMENLEFIQDTLKQRIQYSMDSHDYDMALVSELSTFLRNKVIDKDPLDYTIECDKNESVKLIQEFKTNNFIEKYTFTAKPMLVDLVGQRLEIGVVEIDMHKVQILNDLKELEENMLKLSDSETIDISIKSDKGQKDHYVLKKLPF